MDNVQYESLIEVYRDDNDESLAGMCVACRDQPLVGVCDKCNDEYCEVCFVAHHKAGKRLTHQLIRSQTQETTNMMIEDENSYLGSSPSMNNNDNKEKNDENSHSMTYINDTSSDSIDICQPDFSISNVPSGIQFRKITPFIPLRLTEIERNLFSVIESTLDISDYVDRVDFTYRRSFNSVRGEIIRFLSILSGFCIAFNYHQAKKFRDRSIRDNDKLFRMFFEIARRYKVNNPEKMHHNYAKLLYFLQDSAHLKELHFSFFCPLKTVYTLLENANALNLLDDPRMVEATSDICTKNALELHRAKARKEALQNKLAEEYSNDLLKEEDIKRCILSISDNNSFLRANCDCCDQMIFYLKEYFNPKNNSPNLSIRIGENGSRLSHSHSRQFYYVLQTLSLWKCILKDMFELWYLAEQDLINPHNSYRLVDTGQGYNRIQSSPLLLNRIMDIIGEVKKFGNEWVGSSIVHLGDHNVPNAFFFLTKYLSIAPLLNPIVKCIERIDVLDKDPHLSVYLKYFGGPEVAKINILTDFFKHGFDGSGANNSFDSGSCIDGRLTSAWNWCNKIEKKDYFNIFLLTGFVGFDNFS